MQTPENIQAQWLQEPITSHEKVASWMRDFFADANMRKALGITGHDLTGNSYLRDKFLRNPADTGIRVQVDSFRHPNEGRPEKLKLLVTDPNKSVESFEMVLSGPSLEDYFDYEAKHAS